MEGESVKDVMRSERGDLPEAQASKPPFETINSSDQGSAPDCSKDSDTSTNPDYCRRILVRDAKGAIRELVLPRGLDLERPKRTRTSFTAEQLYRLECEFQRCQYLVGRERTELARQLNLSETQVKVWFQNRRTKHKKDQSKDSGDGRASTSESAATCSVLRLLEQGRLMQPPHPGPTSFLPGACPGSALLSVSPGATQHIGAHVFSLPMPPLSAGLGASLPLSMPLELAVRPLGSSAFEPYSRNGKHESSNHKKGPP